MTTLRQSAAGLLLLSFGLFAAARHAQGALITIDATTEIDSVGSAIPASEIAVGDRFLISLTFDDQAVDTNAGSAGEFPNALQSISLAAAAGNAGTWDPSGGTFTDLSQFILANTRLQVIVSGTGFPTLGGSPLAQISFQLRPPSGFDASGAGKTVAEALGAPLAGNLGDYDYTFTRFDSENFDLVTGALVDLSVRTESTDVPEPGSLILLGTALLFGARARRRRKGSAHGHVTPRQ